MAKANETEPKWKKAIEDIHKRPLTNNCEVRLNYPYYGKGRGIIFVNKDFKKSEKRVGAEKDLEYLKGIYDRYNVDYGEPYWNFILGETHVDMRVRDELEKFAKSIEREACSIIFVSFATHGVLGGNLKMVDQTNLAVKDVVEVFMRQELVDIPKVFIFQACRGPENERSLTDADGGEDIEDSPIYATHRSDVILAYSTCEGYTSFRGEKEEDGSWFLEVLYTCVTAPAYQDLHLVEILTVCSSMIIGHFRKLSIKDEKHPNQEVATQTPAYYSTLRKFIRFPPNESIKDENQPNKEVATETPAYLTFMKALKFPPMKWK